MSPWAKIKKKYSGTFGIVNTFSTFFSHHISTIEGGIVLTNNFKFIIYYYLYDLMDGQEIYLKNFYLKRYQKKYENYCFTIPGYNVRSTNLNAAIGLVQLKKLKKFIEIRRANHQYFSKIFPPMIKDFFQKFSKYHSCFAFTLIIKPKYKHLKNKIFKILRQKKIEFRLVTGGSF